MTVFSKTVKLSDINPTTYVPPHKGIDVIWGYDGVDIYGTFTAANVNTPEYITDKSEINSCLSRLRVIQDTIKDYKTYRKVVPQTPFSLRRTWYDDGNGLKEYK